MTHRLPRPLVSAASLLLLPAFCLVGLADRALAVDYFWTAGASDWNSMSNWSDNLVPEAFYEERGVINNGGIAMLSSVATNTQQFIGDQGVVPGAVAGLVLGEGEGESGTLQVLSGGVINLVDSTGDPQGIANIGLAGTGVLDVRGGGTFGTTLLDVNAGSDVVIGAGVGAASVTSTGGMFLNGTTTVRGSGHTFSAAGTVTLEGQSVYHPVITSGSHTPLGAAGSVALAGQLQVEFDGHAPSVGESWDLFDAPSFSGSFASINAPQTGAGEVYRLRNTSGGSNGRLLKLELAAVLQLTVDWGSGAMAISSPSGALIDIDGYSILSADGSLSTTQWNSLADQAIPGWAEAFPTANALNELNANVGGALSVGLTPLALGAPFNPVIGTFGTPVGEIEFEYATPAGEVFQGLVAHTGDRLFNNLLLTVDPSTGEAQLKNSSLTTISIDGYSILSESGSLEPGNGAWLSLDDQNEGDWSEAAPTATVLSELETIGATTLLPGQGFGLGNLFDASNGHQDLVLEFVLAGESATQTGVVHYGSIVPIATGDADFDNDGDVDGRDFLAWQRGFGATSGATPDDGDANGDGAVNEADLQIWSSQYGSGASQAASANAVPEPSAMVLVLVFAMIAAVRWPR